MNLTDSRTFRRVVEPLWMKGYLIRLTNTRWSEPGVHQVRVRTVQGPGRTNKPASGESAINAGMRSTE
jgi:hypothetical protein